MNDAGDLFSPDTKVKMFLDSLAYYLMLGNTNGIETDYKRIMHAKREIPASSCPSYIENMMYSTIGTTAPTDREESASFKIMVENLDKRAEKYEAQKARRKREQSRFSKYLELGIHGGEWCAVDTDGRFRYDGREYIIDDQAAQYSAVPTEYGDYYAMDKILAANGKFYDMNYDEVKAYATSP